jgi:hypothetical protein
MLGENIGQDATEAKIGTVRKRTLTLGKGLSYVRNADHGMRPVLP